MARYKLLSQHFSEEDKLLEIGTEVGDGTEHKWTRPPTVEMEALDEEGRVALERERIRAGERISPIDDLPLTMGEASAKYEQEVADAAEPPPPPPSSVFVVERERSPPGQFVARTLADRARR